jgi:hypothetical protein
METGQVASGAMILPYGTKNSRQQCMPIHAYRLEYPDSPHAPEMLWEWQKEYIARLLWNATTFGREGTGSV